MTPKIAGPHNHDFHDSSLIDLVVGPQLDTIKIVVSTPDETMRQRLWLIEFTGVLRLEYETLGMGTEEDHDVPLEIYDIYNEQTSDERNRWVQRLSALGVNATDVNKVSHIVLASSFLRGWGKNEHLEGINIICRNVDIRSAPKDYEGLQYARPIIEAGDE